MKTYFVKASCTSPTQPISREYYNCKASLDLSLDEWDILEAVKVACGLNYSDRDNFTIDFMIEVPE